MKAEGAARERDRGNPLGEAGRIGFFSLGCLMLVLGIIGALLPIMPTTIFLILAAWCFGRSSPRLEAWMLDHPRFGPVLRDWREHGAMPRRAKWMACGGMAAGYALFWFAAQPASWPALIVGSTMLVCAVWIVVRPEPLTARCTDVSGGFKIAQSGGEPQ